MTSKDIGTFVREHRKRAGLTRIELAAICGVGKTAIYDIEHGKETVRLRTLRLVLEALNITLRLESPLADQGPEEVHPL